MQFAEIDMQFTLHAVGRNWHAWDPLLQLVVEGEEPANIAMDDPNVQNLVAEVSIKVICRFIFCEIEIIWCKKALMHICLFFLFLSFFFFLWCSFLTFVSVYLIVLRNSSWVG